MIFKIPPHTGMDTIDFRAWVRNATIEEIERMRDDIKEVIEYHHEYLNLLARITTERLCSGDLVIDEVDNDDRF